jgi:acyl-CoA thioesterase-1
LGDSISAGHGIVQSAGWVNLLRERLRRGRLDYRVVNASISGDTTSGGAARLNHILKTHHPAIVILELGGNDGLQGLPLNAMRHNLATIIKRLKQNHSKILLVGMQLPPNYGPAYTKHFSAIYGDLARQFEVPLVPFLLQGVATDPALMQDDGIHPKAAAQLQLLDNLWPYLKPML